MRGGMPAYGGHPPPAEAPMDPVAAFAIFCIFALPVLATVATVALLLTWNLRRKELEVRRLEAQARLEAVGLPAWLDHRDPVAVSEWTAAQRELGRAGAVAAMARG